jgi:glycosyltransferase involved in cell wall biosynthesis
MLVSIGLPQVANVGSGMTDIIEEPGCGLLVDPISPSAIGAAITAILNDPLLHRKMSENARSAHLRKFNYEQQFSPVLAQILAWGRK